MKKNNNNGNESFLKRLYKKIKFNVKHYSKQFGKWLYKIVITTFFVGYLGPKIWVRTDPIDASIRNFAERFNKRNYDAYLSVRFTILEPFHKINYYFKRNYVLFSLTENGILLKRITNFIFQRKFIFALFFIYIITIFNNTLKFESTFLIFFFFIFVNLLYQNIYHFIVLELNNYSFNTYLLFKESISKRLLSIRKNLRYLRIIRAILWHVNSRRARIFLYKFTKNYIFFKRLNNFIVLFLLSNLLSKEFQKQLVTISE